MATTPQIEALAIRAAGELNATGSGGRTFDPTILITIFTTLLKLFGGCLTPVTPAQAFVRVRNMASRNGFGHRLDLRRMRRVIEDNTVGEEDANDVEAAVLDSIDTTTEQEFKVCFAEAQAAP